ncbi:hypothetical protein H5410_041208 [Solanum commersonii]|uniref:Uncharacterized protein n=1 Tax=Solanum commersonii TaxID=4109 RepID=A0A9J5XUT5_SOLCO|nr:hypothetical protein H5410_041208 [Solanum commersonii]
MSCLDIDHWFHFLTKKNVQEFTLHQLQYLELQHCLFHPPQGFKGFEKLINLRLKYVTFVPSIITNLISKSPLLERLRLCWCTNFDTLEIDAANLKFFKFYGKSKSISFNNTPMLEKVIVCFTGFLMDTSLFCSNLTNFFHYTPSLLELHLWDSTLEYLIMGGVGDSLNNIKSLKFFTMSLRNVKEVTCVVYLITSCPKLQHLTIEFDSSGINVEGAVQFLQPQSFLYGALKLQRVQVNMFMGLEMEMEFIKFILASTPVLEEIFFWNFVYLGVRSGKQMIDEIEEFRRAHHLILPLKDAVKTSILSKDWRYKWVTRAKLDFCSEFFTSFNDNQEAKKIIYQVLRLHQGPVLKFTLQHPNLICYHDIYNWMLFLSKKNVQELTLQIFTGNKYHLPSYLFTFQKLRHLDLDVCFFHPPPDFKGFAELISINLQHVIFDPTIFRNLITKCPLLESLMLTRYTTFDVLEIDAPNLKCFNFLG